MKTVRVFELWFVCLFIFCLPIFAIGADKSPTGTENRAVKLVQSDDTEIAIDARMAAWKKTFEFWKNGAVMMMPKSDVPVVKEIKSILLPFSLNDIPGGRVYIVRMEESKDCWFWKADLEAQNAPLAAHVVIDSNNFKASKGPEGVGTVLDIQGTGVFKKGRYAVCITNNKYAWDFMVE